MNISIIQKLGSGIIASFIAVFCFAPKLSNLFLFFYAILIFFLIFKKQVSFHLQKLNVFLIYLFIFYFVGVIFGIDRALSIKVVEYKLSLLIFPLIFSVKGKNFNILNLNWVKTGLIIGVIITSLLSLYNSFSCYLTSAKLLCFFTTSISHIHHPSYYVVFHLFALLFSWQGYFKKELYFRLSWIIPFSIVSIIVQFLCLSLAGLLYFFLLILFFSLYWLYINKSIRTFFVSLLIVPSIAITTFFAVPQFEGEFNGAYQYVNEYVKSPTDFVRNRNESMSGSEERLVLWTVAVQECIEHPFGVGTGNVNFYLNKRLIDNGQTKLAHKNYDPHNQYLQILLELGIFCFAFFIVILLFCLRSAWKSKNWILGILVFNLMFNSLFESMLQRQSGIVFYCFWIALVLSFDHDLKKQKIK